MSATEIYKRLEMYEDCVENLALAGQMAPAKEMAEKLLKEDPSPKLLSVCGDIFQDIKYYK